MRKILLFLGFLSLVFNSFAQDTSQNSCPCCADNYNSFDFWLGDWTVYDVNGKIVGKNLITKEYDNCVLKEQWTSAGKNRGTSYNYYNSKEKTWNQVWVDNSGFSLTLKGSYIDNKMVLKSEMQSNDKGEFYNQITWENNKDGTVTQTWDVLNKNNEKVQQLFKGIYKKTVK